MFGIAVARLDKVTEAEKERYQALYCGLCMELKRRYGQVSRAALSYDLAFLVMFYDSLYEPPEQKGLTHCITHPRKRMPYAISEFTSYCADLSVALAYHKCLDDIADDGSRAVRLASAALRGAYDDALTRIPIQCGIMDSAMSAIRDIESSADPAPDATSIAFGDMLGFLVECAPGHFPDIWSERLRDFGYWLGRFICLMDAAVDFKEDAKSGAYNPLVGLSRKPNPGLMRDMLSGIAERMTSAFEKLPLVQDANLMRSVLYSGVWQQFNKTYERKDGRDPK